MNKFITPVAMKATKEQYERDLKETLQKLGYGNTELGSEGDFVKYDILTNFYNDSFEEPEVGTINDILFKSTLNECYIIEEYSKDLFLALAAMTETDVPIKEEYMIALKDTDCDHYKGEIIKDFGCTPDYSREAYRKASKEELIQHFSKKEFILPDLWRVKDCNIVSQWVYDTIFTINLGCEQTGYCCINEKSRQTGSDSCYAFYYDKEDFEKYTEITLEEFKQHVLKTNNMQTLQVGQQIPKPIKTGDIQSYDRDGRVSSSYEYEISLKGRPIEEIYNDLFRLKGDRSIYFKISDFMENNNKEIIGYKCPTDLFKGAIKRDTVYVLHAHKNIYYPNTYSSYGESKFTEQLPCEIVETWEPVYKEEYKVGDWVVVLPEDPYYHNCQQGQAQKIQQIHLKSNLLYSLLLKDNTTNSYKLIRKATPEEIEKAKVQKVDINDISLTIKNNKVYHDKDDTDITDYVKAIENLWTNTLKGGNLIFHNFSFNISDISLNKTGCRNVDSSIKQWLDVAKMIK